MKKISFILTLILFIILPLLHSKIGGYFGLDIGYFVEGNFEFTKSIFFNIFSGLIILFYIIENKKINISPIALGAIMVLIIHLIFQYFFGNNFYTSLFGSSEKGHGVILFFNLILLSQILISYKKEEKRTLLYSIFAASIIINLIALKEFFLPSFDYGDLSNRALGSFGHPNYLAFYNIIILLLLFRQKLDNKWTADIILISAVFFAIATLIYTKSAIGIGIFLSYFLYRTYKHFSEKISITKSISFIVFILLSLLGLVYLFQDFGVLVKLNSFVSRFYIWETSIVATIKESLFFGSGPDGLSYIFDTYKNPLLYIFENIGYTADRPHNIFIYSFTSFGVLGLGYFLYSLFLFYKKRQYFLYFHIIILSLLFLSFNFASISGYLLFIFVLSYYKNKTSTTTKIQVYSKKISSYLAIVIIMTSLMQIIHNYHYYAEEHRYFSSKEFDSKYSFIQSLRYEDPEKAIFHSAHSVEEVCKNLIENIPTVENYFYCGKLFADFNQVESKNHYQQGLKLLPDMWNKNSNYYNSFLVRELYSEKRFMSEKYSDIKNILEIVEHK